MLAHYQWRAASYLNSLLRQTLIKNIQQIIYKLFALHHTTYCTHSQILDIKISESIKDTEKY